MNVLNQHQRIINQPKGEISKLIKKLASREDVIWPYGKWSPMIFKDGLKVGSKGGHGIIRYTIIEYNPDVGIKFQFTSPKGFNGTHEFSLVELGTHKTKVNHVIKMRTDGMATLKWMVCVRWLHDALTEDALDNIENHFSVEKKTSKWSAWVKLWRWIFIRAGKTRVKTSPHHG